MRTIHSFQRHGCASAIQNLWMYDVSEGEYRTATPSLALLA